MFTGLITGVYVHTYDTIIRIIHDIDESSFIDLTDHYMYRELFWGRYFSSCSDF